MKKKIGILLAILLIAGVCAMADESTASQDEVLFADIDAVTLSLPEMDQVNGGLPIAIPIVLATPADEIIIAAGAVVAAKVAKEIKDYVVSMKEHGKKGTKNPAHEEKHQKGQTRKGHDKKGGEKGDKRRGGRR